MKTRQWSVELSEIVKAYGHSRQGYYKRLQREGLRSEKESKIL